MEKGAMRCEANVSVRPVGQGGSAPRSKSRTSTLSGRSSWRWNTRSPGRSTCSSGRTGRAGDDGVGRRARADGPPAQQGIVRRLSLLPRARSAAAGGRSGLGGREPRPPAGVAGCQNRALRDRRWAWTRREPRCWPTTGRGGVLRGCVAAALAQPTAKAVVTKPRPSRTGSPASCSG